MTAITPWATSKQIAYCKWQVMGDLGRGDHSLINFATMQLLSFVSPRQSRYQKNHVSPRWPQDANGGGTFFVAAHPQAPPPTRDQSGVGGARGPAAAWKGSSDPRRDAGDSKEKRSILEKSEYGRGRGGLHFTPGLITREELHWDQHPYGQTRCSVCGSQGTNPWPPEARRKMGDIGLAGVWGTHSLNVACCWQHPLNALQICSFQRSFIIKTQYRKKTQTQFLHEVR